MEDTWRPRQLASRSAMYACERLVADTASVSEVLQRLVDGARQLLGAPASWLAQLGPDGLRIAAHSGLRNPDMPARWSLEMGQGIGGAVAASGQPTLVRDYRRDPRRVSLVKLIIDEEKLRSAAVVPVSAAGALFGVLYVADPRPGRISADDIELLALYARIGAVALERAKQRASLLSHTEALERDAGGCRLVLGALQQSAELLLAGADTGQALAPLSAALELSLELSDPAGHVVGSAGDQGGQVVAEHALSVYDAPVGTLAARQAGCSEGPGAEVTSQALALAAAMLSLHLARHKERYETEQRLSRQLLSDLLKPARDHDDLLSRSSLMGLDIEAPRVVCCVGIHEGPTGSPLRPPVLSLRSLQVLEVALARRFACTITILQGALAVVLLPHPSGDRTALLRDLGAVLADASRGLGGMPLAAGLGPACTSLDDYPVSYHDAALALELARSRVSGGGVVASEELGVYGLLAGALDPEALRSRVLPVLAPLLESDRQRHTDHVRTLRAYLSNDRHLQHTAEDLHLHVNSLRYRLRRIEQLLQMDFHDSDDLFQLELAVRIADLHAFGEQAGPSRV